MSSAKASGSDAKPNGDARNRSHHDGSSSRAYTVEQKAAVIRVRKCGPTAFYDILGLEESRTTCNENEIKKAYRKLSLLTHPDKNGYDGADEAFKMVSRAFQVLSDPDKKQKFDKFGHDPDSRFGAASAGASSPFSGFARRSASGQGPNSSFFEEEISPEEMFRQFFGGGFGGGFGPFGGFDTGPQFVFNLGGGPGVRVHQFGGGRPRRRPADANAPPQTPTQNLTSMLSSLLPLLLLFILPLLSSIFSSSGSSGPRISLQSHPPYTKVHTSSRLGVPYFVDPSEVRDYRTRDWASLDKVAENHFVQELHVRCDQEHQAKQQAMYSAQGWIFQDDDAMARARKMKVDSCDKLDALRQGRKIA